MIGVARKFLEVPPSIPLAHFAESVVRVSRCYILKYALEISPTGQRTSSQPSNGFKTVLDSFLYQC